MLGGAFPKQPARNALPAIDRAVFLLSPTGGTLNLGSAGVGLICTLILGVQKALGLAETHSSTSAKVWRGEKVMLATSRQERVADPGF